MASETESPPVGVDCRRVCGAGSPHEGTRLWAQCACGAEYQTYSPSSTASNTSISLMDSSGSHEQPSNENIIHILVPSIVIAVFVTLAIGGAIILYKKRRKSSANKKSKAAYMKVENSYDYNGHNGMNVSRNNNDSRGEIYKDPSRQSETADNEDYKARVSFLNDDNADRLSNSPGGTRRTLLGKFPTSGSKGLQDKILEMTEIVDIDSDQEGSPTKKSKRQRSVERRGGTPSRTSTRNSYAHLPPDNKYYHSGSFG